MVRPRNAIVPGVGALALALCTAVSGCSQQSSDQTQQNTQRPQSTRQQQNAQQPPSTDQQRAQQAPLSTDEQQSTQQPPSTDQQQAQQAPESPDQQQSAQRPPSTDQQEAQQAPPSTDQQQSAQRPSSTDQQQAQQEPPSTDQQQSAQQQPQNQSNNRQNASSGENGSAAVNLNRGQIIQVQRALEQKGFNVGRIDGRMGPKTEDALRSFQQQQKLEQSGQIDQQTLGALGLSALTRSTVGRGGGEQQPAPGEK